MSATRPATELSIGIMPSSTSPEDDRREGILEGGAGQRLGIGIGLEAGDVGVGAGLALEGDPEPRGGLGLGHVRPSRISAGAVELVRRVDPQRNGGDHGDVDAHAGLERAKLLQPLAPLERRGRQRDETLQRGAAIGIEADMVEERRPRPRVPWRA